MKRTIAPWYSGLILISPLTILAQQGQTSKMVSAIENDQVRIQVCDPRFKDEMPVEMKWSNQLENLKPRAKASQFWEQGKNCVRVTLASSAIPNGQSLIMTFATNQTLVVQASDFSSLKKIASGAAQNSTPTIPAPQPPVSASGTAGASNAVLQAKIESEARKAGNQFAKTVVASFGKIEMMRRNYLEGFKSAQEMANSLGATIENAPEYRYGKADARGKLLAEGQRFGIQMADEKAMSIAINDVTSSIDEALTANSQNPNFLPRQNFEETINKFLQTKLDFNNKSLPLQVRQALASPEEKSISENLEQRIQDDLKRHLSNDSEVFFLDSMLANQVSLPSESRQVRLYDSYFIWSHTNQATHAFLAWGLGEIRSKNRQEALDFATFENLIAESGDQNKSIHRALYQKSFMNAYDSSLAESWKNMVSRNNDQMRRLGVETFKEMFGKMAYEQGSVDQRREDFAAGAQASFSENLAKMYKMRFDEKVLQAQTSAFLSGVHMSVEFNGQDISTSTLTIGDKIDVVINQAVNRGMKSGEARVSVNGLKQVDNGQFELAGLSKLSAPIHFTQIFEVSNLKNPDAGITFNVLVTDGIMNFQTNIAAKTSFEAMLERMTSTSDQMLQNRLKLILLDLLKTEWKTRSGIGNGYDDTDEIKSSYLGRLSILAQINPSVKSALKKISNELRKTINDGSRPDGFFSTSKDDYDSAVKLLSDAGI